MEEEKLTWADIMRGFEESKRRNEELAVQTAETKALMKEVFSRMDKRSEKSKAEMAAMRAEVAGIGTSNGMFAEDIFYRTLWRKKEFAGIHFDDVTDKLRGLKKLPDGKRLQDQFDIVMLNDVAAAILESKYRARKENVTTLVEKKLKNFKILFPYHKDLKIYLGLAALSFEDDVVEEARKYGVGLLQQVGETVEYATAWEVKAY